MKAVEIHRYMKEKGTWVNWRHTTDRFLAGSSKKEVSKVAVSWMPTLPNLKKAQEMGCDMFITHEGLYARKPSKKRLIPNDDVFAETKRWLKENDIVVYRCHDVWDDFPDVGIHGSWASSLGFNPAEPYAKQKFYEVHEFEPKPFKEFASQIAENLKKLNQNVIHCIGDPEQIVSKIALGTGAITNYRVMHQMGADLLLITDDGTRLWETAQWAHGTDVAIIVVNHATAEEPGMKTLTNYLNTTFPQVEFIHIPVGCLYWSISS